MDMTRTHPPPLQIPIILYNLQPPFVQKKNELVTLMTNPSITIGALMEHFLKRKIYVTLLFWLNLLMSV